MKLCSHPRCALEFIWNQLPENAPRFALFTSFGFSSDMFEHEVLPRLCGLEVSQANANHVNRRLESKKIHIVAAVDRSLVSSKGSYGYCLLPVGIQNGRFHPKITLVCGGSEETPEAWIVVSSANMTRSGWSRNTEVSAYTRVEPRDIAPLLSLLQWLQVQEEKLRSELYALEGHPENILKNLRDRLQRLFLNATEKERTRPSRLFLTIPDASGVFPSDMLSHILAQNRWDSLAFHSPYWHGAEQWVSRIQRQVHECNWITTFSGKKNGKYAFCAETLMDKAPCRYKFADNNAEAQQRFIHAKIQILKNDNEVRLVVGSVNATSAALLQKSSDSTMANIEAALCFDLPSQAEFAEAIWNTWGNPERFQPLAPEQLELYDLDMETDGAPPLLPYTLLVQASFQQGRWLYYASVSDSIEAKAISLRIGAKALGTFELDGTMALVLDDSELSRSFTCQTPDGAVFSGLVMIGNCASEALGYYPEIPMEALLLDIFRTKAKIGHSMNVYHEGDDTSHSQDEETDDEEDDKEDPIDSVEIFDPFRFYRAWYGKRKEILENRDWLQELSKSIEKRSVKILTMTEAIRLWMVSQLILETGVIAEFTGHRLLRQYLGNELKQCEHFGRTFKDESAPSKFLNWWQEEHTKIWRSRAST